MCTVSSLSVVLPDAMGCFQHTVHLFKCNRDTNDTHYVSPSKDRLTLPPIAFDLIHLADCFTFLCVHFVFLLSFFAFSFVASIMMVTDLCASVVIVKT